jgi:hypothetical protein
MNSDGWWTGKDLEERISGKIDVLSPYLLGETEEHHEETWVRTAGVSAEIRNEHLPNKNLRVAVSYYTEMYIGH